MFLSKSTKEYKKSHKGFTLVETLVAVSILLVVIVGPMTIAQKGIQSAYYAGDQTTAIYLAQEAIEYMQRLRDDVALEEFQEYQTLGNNGNDDTWSWYSSLDADCKQSDGCDIDFIGNDFQDCTTQSQCILRINPATNGNRVYAYSNTSGWTDSKFERRIRVGTATGAVGPAAGGVPVTVTVSWDSGSAFGGTKSVILQTYVYDHYSRFR